MNTEIFWLVLTGAAIAALCLNAGCLLYLYRGHELSSPDAGVLTVLRFVAILECLPLIYLIAYFVWRVSMSGEAGFTEAAVVIVASIGYSLILVGLCLASISGVVIVRQRRIVG